MDSQTMNATFLRRSLQLDGVASGACGVLLLAAAGPISGLAGLPGPTLARAVGGLLVIYAVALLWNARRASVSRGQALAAVVLNGLWVVGSAVVIADGPLTPIGNLAVAAVATAVLVFAMLEAVGLRRLRQA
jgi:peptidoglycan/LPS O-acetylase OafA/YrhL